MVTVQLEADAEPSDQNNALNFRHDEAITTTK